MTTRRSILMKYHDDLGALLLNVKLLQERCVRDGHEHAEKELACLGQVNFNLHESYKHIVEAGQRIVREIENDTNPTYL